MEYVDSQEKIFKVALPVSLELPPRNETLGFQISIGRWDESRPPKLPDSELREKVLSANVTGSQQALGLV
jgi:hypothetical protein